MHIAHLRPAYSFPVVFCYQWCMGFVWVFNSSLIKPQRTWPFHSLLPSLLEEDGSTLLLTAKTLHPAPALQSGAWCAHRALLSFRNKAIRASLQAFSALHPNQGRHGCCVYHTAGQVWDLDTVQKMHPPAGGKSTRGISSFAVSEIARAAAQQLHFVACWVHLRWGMINEGPAVMGQEHGSGGQKNTPEISRTLWKKCMSDRSFELPLAEKPQYSNCFRDSLWGNNSPGKESSPQVISAWDPSPQHHCQIHLLWSVVHFNIILFKTRPY